MEDDPYRWCIYCGADCDLIEPCHRDDCPIQTGVFPVYARDLENHGFICMDCGYEFKEGDFYVVREAQHNIVEGICLGCGALEFVK